MVSPGCAHWSVVSTCRDTSIVSFVLFLHAVLLMLCVFFVFRLSVLLTLSAAAAAAAAAASYSLDGMQLFRLFGLAFVHRTLSTAAATVYLI